MKIPSTTHIIEDDNSNWGVIVKKNFFTPDNAYADWDSIHYKTICTVIVEGCVDVEEIVESMLFSLCQVGLLEAGDSFKFSMSGDMIIIGKAHSNIKLNYEDTVN